MSPGNKKSGFDVVYNLKSGYLEFVEKLGRSLSEYILTKEKRSDQEFLPAALSIVETPPSPVAILMLRVICALAVFAIGWMYFGHIDVIAIAQGKLQPSGRVKTIQSLEAGRVTSINVRNGQHVKAGDILIEMDSSEAVAEERGSLSSYYSLRAEAIRRKASIEAAANINSQVLTKLIWPKVIPNSIREREEGGFRSDVEQLKSGIQSLEAQISQKEREKNRLEGQIASQEMLVDTLKQRVTMRKGLLARGSTSKAAVIDAMESLQAQETTLAGQKGQYEESKAAIIVLIKEKKKEIDRFIADNQQKLSDAERQADELEQRVAKAHVKTDHMNLAAPMSGTVLGLTVTTRNQVLQSGEEVMRIVPDDAKLEIEAYVQNKDIGFVKVGQEAVIKIESFPFTRFGTIKAVVMHVSHDAIPEPDATNAEGAPSRSRRDTFFGGAQRTQNLVYQVLLILDQDYIGVEGVRIPLASGMAVSAEIKTGRRRIFDYIFAPLVEVASRAMKER